MDPDERRALGAHYTSEKNIMKVIRPLFLDYLIEELDKLLAAPDNKEKKKGLTEYRSKPGRLKFLEISLTDFKGWGVAA